MGKLPPKKRKSVAVWQEGFNNNEKDTEGGFNENKIA